jgi:dihydropteroate synthase
VIPVITALARQSRVPISIDTRNAKVMRRAAEAGAGIINDVAALGYDPNALSVAVETCLPVVLMHAQGDPRTMQLAPHYDDVVLDVYDWLEARIAACEAAGIGRERIVVDPGIGFGKTLGHNLALLSSLSIFHGFGCPVLLGASRKSFIGRLSGGAPADRRMPGSVAAALLGATQGVQILRVHDVAATRQALAVWEAAQGM